MTDGQGGRLKRDSRLLERAMWTDDDVVQMACGLAARMREVEAALLVELERLGVVAEAQFDSRCG
jgi:hypothetical protein